MNFKSESFRWDAEAQPLERALKLHFAGASWNDVRRLIATGKVKVDEKVASDARTVVPSGSLIAIHMTAPRRQVSSQVNDPRILYCDSQLVVVNKPCGLSSVDHEAEPSSLQSEIHQALERAERRTLPPLYVVHRLDKVTSGVMLFARNRSTQVELKAQFRAHSTGRRYVAVAHGEVRACTLQYRLVRDRGDGMRGVTSQPNIGTNSITHVTVLERISRCTVIQCQLETGRTHQIRIHLSEIGHPIVGEPLYTRGFKGALIPCSRTLLHAAFLSFEHPQFKQRREYDVPLPEGFTAFLEQERKLLRRTGSNGG